MPLLSVLQFLLHILAVFSAFLPVDIIGWNFLAVLPASSVKWDQLDRVTTPIDCIAWREGIRQFVTPIFSFWNMANLLFFLRSTPRGIKWSNLGGIFTLENCHTSLTVSPLMDLREAPFTNIEINMLYFRCTDLSITWFLFLLHVNALLIFLCLG